MKTFFVFAGTVLLACASSGQDWAKARLDQSPRHLEWVTITNGSRAVKCFIAYPEVKQKAPAIIVIHEIFGLTDWVRTVVDDLAAAGYIAIAPDLLSGSPGGGGTAELGGNDAVRKAITSLPQAQIDADLDAVSNYLTQLPACNGKLAVAGFCWGGTQSFRYATHSKNLKAAFVFYGSGPDQNEEIKRISCPVYGFYGGNDARVTSTVDKTKELMKTHDKKFDPVIYKDAGHGFMRAGQAPDASADNKRALHESWDRWRSLLKKL